MSALAQISKYQGNDVYGSDRSFDQGKDQKNKAALEELGIKIYPQDGSMLDKDFSVLYASTAVEDTIPDIKRAHELNIPIKRRSDLLAEIFASYSKRIAVGGTSGKSTVTAMIGYILDKAGLKPLVINGALLKNYENQGVELGLNKEEKAFYDALLKPQALKDYYVDKNEDLINIVRELTDTLNKNKTIDWQKREQARADMRSMVKRLLKKYNYPPKERAEALSYVMAQCERWADNL